MQPADAACGLSRAGMLPSVGPPSRHGRIGGLTHPAVIVVSPGLFLCKVLRRDVGLPS